MLGSNNSNNSNNSSKSNNSNNINNSNNQQLSGHTHSTAPDEIGVRSSELQKNEMAPFYSRCTVSQNTEQTLEILGPTMQRPFDMYRCSRD